MSFHCHHHINHTGVSRSRIRAPGSERGHVESVSLKGLQKVEVTPFITASNGSTPLSQVAGSVASLFTTTVLRIRGTNVGVDSSELACVSQHVSIRADRRLKLWCEDPPSE